MSASLAVVRSAVRDLGVRRARLRWVVTEPVALTIPLANALRGALGAALYEAGAARAYALAWDDAGPPGLWFQGWHCSCLDAGAHLEADLMLLRVCEDHWPALLAGLGSLSVAGGRVRLCGITWDGGGAGWDWPVEALLSAAPVAEHGRVIVEAVAPLQLKLGGRPLGSAPPLKVLAHSAGDRLRKLHDRWCGGDRDLSAAVGALVRASSALPVELAPTTVVEAARNRGPQRLRGVVGAWRYSDCGPPAALLGVGQLLGMGKGTAFGCGALRVGVQPWTC